MLDNNAMVMRDQDYRTAYEFLGRVRNPRLDYHYILAENIELLRENIRLDREACTYKNRNVDIGYSLLQRERDVKELRSMVPDLRKKARFMEEKVKKSYQTERMIVCLVAESVLIGVAWLWG